SASCRAGDGSVFAAVFEAWTAPRARISISRATASPALVSKALLSKSVCATRGRALRSATCPASLMPDSAPGPAVPDSDSPSAAAFSNSTEARLWPRAAPVMEPPSGSTCRATRRLGLEVDSDICPDLFPDLFPDLSPKTRSHRLPNLPPHPKPGSPLEPGYPLELRYEAAPHRRRRCRYARCARSPLPAPRMAGRRRGQRHRSAAEVSRRLAFARDHGRAHAGPRRLRVDARAANARRAKLVGADGGDLADRVWLRTRRGRSHAQRRLRLPGETRLLRETRTRRRAGLTPRRKGGQ